MGINDCGNPVESKGALWVMSVLGETVVDPSPTVVV